MIKLALRRGFIGLPWGIAIAQIIALAVSIAAGTGEYYLVPPETAEYMGSELAAVTLQTCLCALLGFIWGMLSVIWQIETWSLLKQSLVFFVLGMTATLATEYFCGWIDLNWLSLLRFIGIFSAIFVVIWIALYKFICTKIRKMNDALKDKRN